MRGLDPAGWTLDAIFKTNALLDMEEDYKKADSAYQEWTTRGKGRHG